jgi:dynein heavy chain, axonemal
MDGVQFVAAMGPPGGGRNSVTSRYLRHFSLMSITDFDDATLTRIFSSLLGWGQERAGFALPIKVLASVPDMLA